MMKVFKILLIFVVVSFSAAGAFASGLDGLWKHDEEAVWVEIQSEGDTATGNVRRNDNKPESLKCRLNDAADFSQRYS